jgi:hypothetical protein
MIGCPVSDADLHLFTLHGLSIEYDSLVVSLNFRSDAVSLMSFVDCFSLMSSVLSSMLFLLQAFRLFPLLFQLLLLLLHLSNQFYHKLILLHLPPLFLDHLRSLTRILWINSPPFFHLKDLGLVSQQASPHLVPLQIVFCAIFV